MKTEMAVILADALVILHLAFVVFVMGGGFLLARWPKLAWLHLPSAAWGAYIEFSGGICPLTPLENYLRMLGGDGTYRGDFVEHYLLPILYPENLTSPVQLVLGAIVVGVNLTAYALACKVWRSKREKGQAATNNGLG
jgi:multisubunit Na+/H+ antiporter MnhC subunit